MRTDGYRSRYLKMRSVLHDRTTGLPAIPVLLEQLRTQLDDRPALGVIHLEIESLDLVESLYGWQVLDRLLATVAAELRQSCGEELPRGSLLGVNAVAGDRFAVFVVEREDGREVDDALLASCARAVSSRLDGALAADEFSGIGPTLRAKSGHALLSRNPFYRFERCVYAALAEAGQWQSEQRLRRERNLTHDLEKIIQDSNVSTVFHPVIDLRDRSVLGYEALSRGPIDTPLEAPLALFAASAEVGVAADLDRTCRNSAMRAIGELAAPGKLFLNALPDSLGEDLAQQADLLDAAEKVALAAHDLVLEFSERDAQADPEGFADRLTRLRHRGFSIALDDVGTGHAGQTVLERVRPDFLKLDGSLVRGIDSNLIKQELIVSLIRIAAQLGASVIAEGIETEAEALLLKEVGAQYGQGFYFGMPQSAERFAQLDLPEREH